MGTLKINSIKKKNGIWGIDFNEMVKNTSSERFTPLAQTLIDLGFLKYASYQKKQKETKGNLGNCFVFLLNFLVNGKLSWLFLLLWKE